MARGPWAGGNRDVLRLPYRDRWPSVVAVSPYTVVVVQLWYSGIKMLSNLVCDDFLLVHIGLKVRVSFEAVNERIALPKFFPL